MNNSYEKEWDALVGSLAFDVYAMDELEDMPEIQFKLFTQIEVIFTQLKKLSRGRFFKQRELDVTWIMLRQDIFFLNDLATEGGVIRNVYNIVMDLFDDLIKIAEVKTDYECASNLLKFRDMWFSAFNIKIKNASAEQK
jgi:hypothetical protein